MKNLLLDVGFENKETQKTIGNESTYIARLYSRFISDLKIADLRKIHIQFVD